MELITSHGTSSGYVLGRLLNLGIIDEIKLTLIASSRGHEYSAMCVPCVELSAYKIADFVIGSPQMIAHE